VLSPFRGMYGCSPKGAQVHADATLHLQEADSGSVTLGEIDVCAEDESQDAWLPAAGVPSDAGRDR